MNILTNFFRDLIFKIIYKNIKIYSLVLRINSFTNLLLPHEKEIFGFKKLKYKKNEFLIDVGSGNGLFLRSMNKIGYCGKAICIDPLYENKKIFNTLIRRKKNITFFSKAVSRKKKIYLYTPIFNGVNLNNWTSLSKIEIFKNFKSSNFNLNHKNVKFLINQFSCIPLDKFINKKISIIKIDVEGNELDVIKSGINLIRKHKPIIYIENNTRTKKDTNFAKINPILRKYKYKCFFYNYKTNILSKKYDNKTKNIFFLLETKHFFK